MKLHCCVFAMLLSLTAYAAVPNDEKGDRKTYYAHAANTSKHCKYSVQIVKIDTTQNVCVVLNMQISLQGCKREHANLALSVDFVSTAKLSDPNAPAMAEVEDKLKGQVVCFMVNERGYEIRSETDKNEQSAVCRDFMRTYILPILFVQIPDTYEPAVGFKWGKYTDDPKKYKSKITPAEWEIIGIDRVPDARKTVTFQSRQRDSTSVDWADNASSELHIVSHYDELNKRVRSGMSSYRAEDAIDKKTGDSKGVQSEYVIVNEIP